LAGPSADDGWQPSEDDTARVDAQLERWRQGDVGRPGINVHVGNVAVPLVVEDRDALEEDHEGGEVRAILSDVEAVAIVSQTCDVVRSCAQRPFVKVSPVVTLTGELLANASAGRVPRYAALPGLGADVFADLDRCTTITKSTLAGMNHERGCPDDKSIADFGEAVGRHHERYAFPDFVERALGPLSSQMAKRARKNSPEGRCVDSLVEVRAVATPEWDSDEPITIDGDLSEAPWSRATAHARLARLHQDQVITGYHAAVDPRALGLDIVALILLNVDQHAWRLARDQLLQVNGLEYLAFTSGDFDMVALVRAPDIPHLRDVVLVEIQAITEVRNTETIFVLDELGRPLGSG